FCIINCPENIIRFVPDEKKGVKVLGADTNQFCKLCRECIEVCPVDLFKEVGSEALEGEIQ
ncbi:MAG: 4Fe-4S dicluster domain-containing protein, partial [bacterium]|nr:4Fe-4S dicluster domain-containing protein [bacterium]